MRLISKDCPGYQAYFSLSRQLQEEMFGPGAFHRKPCKGLGLCPSGGPFLVPPRKGERKRLKGALSVKPPPLRISPASEEAKSVLGHFRRGKCAYLGTMKLRDLAYPLGWTSPRRIS